MVPTVNTLLGPLHFQLQLKMGHVISFSINAPHYKIKLQVYYAMNMNIQVAAYNMT